MPHAPIDDGVRLYYELTGPEEGPAVLQFGGELVEFPDIGHADLVGCPQDAVRIVSEFFEKALAAS